MQSKSNVNEKFELKHPELKKNEQYTSPASSLPLYELKMLQDYIHGVNLQNLRNSLPKYQKHLMLLKFFKHKRNQLVEVFSRNNENVIHTVGKVKTIGRDFVMLETLFSRFWIPYDSIQSAKTPFGIPDVPSSHQHVIYDEELRNKLLTDFGNTVSGKETLRQQFYDELLETNLKVWQGTKLLLYENTLIKGRVMKAEKGKLFINNPLSPVIPIKNINYVKQYRISAFFQRLFTNKK